MTINNTFLYCSPKSLPKTLNYSFKVVDFTRELYFTLKAVSWNEDTTKIKVKNPEESFSVVCISQVWVQCTWTRWSAPDLRSPSQSVSSTRMLLVAAMRRTHPWDVTFLLWASRSRWASALFQSNITATYKKHYRNAVSNSLICLWEPHKSLLQKGNFADFSAVFWWL